MRSANEAWAAAAGRVDSTAARATKGEDYLEAYLLSLQSID